MKIKSLSATQYTDFARCARYWYFKNVAKLPTPTTKSLDLGTAIHDGVEKRIKAGSMDAVPAGVRDYVLALDKRGMFPTPRDAVCESWMRLDTHLGVPWIGKVDLVVPGLNLIRDWKSSSNIARYAKPPIELMGDLQLNSYGEWAYQTGHFDVTRGARLELVYVQTPAPKRTLPQVKPVGIDATRASVRAVWDGAKKQLDDMALASEASCADDVTPNTSACGMYGGCPFQKNCGADLYEGIGSFTSKSPSNTSPGASIVMGFMDRYKNLTGNGANGNGAGHAPPPAMPAAVPQVVGHVAPDPVPREETAAEWNAKQAARAAQEAARQAKLDADFGPAQAAPLPAANQIVPSDAPARDAYPDEASVKAAGGMSGSRDVPDDDSVVNDEPLSTDAPPATDPAPVAEPKKRGRPRKAADAVGAAPTTQDAVQAMQAAQLPARTPAGAPMMQRPAFTIYVDCFPTKGRGDVDVIFADDWFAPVETEINEFFVKEKNLPTFWAASFADQKGALAIGVQNRIAKGLPAAMVFRSGSNVTREVFPMLAPHATQIIQAMR